MISNVACKPTYWRSGSNPGVCKPCSNTNCGSQQCREGSCSGTSNGFSCTDHPTCLSNQFLQGGSGTAAHTCTGCSNVNCASNSYRAGSCSGTSNEGAGEWYIEGVKEEMDQENEFWYDDVKHQLHFIPNGTAPPTDIAIPAKPWQPKTSPSLVRLVTAP